MIEFWLNKSGLNGTRRSNIGVSIILVLQAGIKNNCFININSVTKFYVNFKTFLFKVQKNRSPSLNSQSCIIKGLFLVVRDYCFCAVWAAGLVNTEKKYSGSIISNF